jgi:hypothetical protein
MPSLLDNPGAALSAYFMPLLTWDLFRKSALALIDQFTRRECIADIKNRVLSAGGGTYNTNEDDQYWPQYHFHHASQEKAMPLRESGSRA